MSVVNEIKSQYARVLRQSDWRNFKEIAEYYLETAAKLKIKDISSSKNQLLLRNSQERLFLGIGCELLLKSFYLKNGYCVNKLRSNYGGAKDPVHKLSALADADIDPNDTFTMNRLIEKLGNIAKFQDHAKIKRGFQIAMTFRNKEGHVTFPSHAFDPNNYKDIAAAVETFYAQAFGQDLTFKVSMESNEKPVFRINT